MPTHALTPWLVLLGLLPALEAGGTVVEVRPSDDQVTLNRHVHVFVDATAKMGLDEVRAPDVAARFEAHSRELPPSFGLTPSAVWLRVSLRNTGEQPLRRMLHFDHHTLQRIEIHQTAAGREATAMRGGRHVSVSQSPSQVRGHAFGIELPPGEVQTVYARIESDSELLLPVSLWEERALLVREERRGLGFGIAYGFLLAMALYNLFLFFFVRERAHLYYCCQISCWTTWIASIDGTLVRALPGVEVLPHGVYFALGCGGAFFALLFMDRFLDLPAARPRLAKIARGTMVCVVALPVLGGTLFSAQTTNALTSLLVLLIIVGGLTAGALRWRDGFTPARYLVAAWGAMVSVDFILILTAMGLGSTASWYLLPHLSLTLEALLLSLALAESLKQKNTHILRLQEAGGRFVPFELLALLGARQLPDVRRGDQVERVMTVYFSDIRSFTQLAEQMTPEQTIDFVNAYLDRMEPVISRNRGVIDKYIGDAVMALFEDADDAVTAARECIEALDELNRERATTQGRNIRIGIGLHTGPLVLGTVGSDARMSCTVLGDSVNLAARLESMTKDYGASVLLSGSTRAAMQRPDVHTLRRVGRVAAKGKREAADIHELLDALPEAARQTRLANREEFEAACDLMVAGNAQEALRKFAACISRDPEDRAALLCATKCREAIEREGDDAWSGVVRFEG